MLEKRRKTGFILSILAAIMLLTSGIFVYHALKTEDHITIKEMIMEEEKNGSGWFLPNGTVFYIRDKVIQTSTFRLPEPVINGNNYSVDTNNICTYTAVYFESAPREFQIFEGNREDEFSEGKIVEFDLPVKQYIDKEYGNLSCTEPTYNIIKTMQIVGSIAYGNFAFVSLDVNSTGNGTFILTVDNVFLPTNAPIYWSTVYFKAIPEDSWTTVNPEVQLFSSDGRFAGKIGIEENNQTDKDIEIGDYLVIKNITLNTTFILNGDAFSSFDSPNTDSDNSDLFLSAPLVYLQLGPREVE